MSARTTWSAESRVRRSDQASWLPLLLLMPLSVSALVDLPRHLQAGSITALGALGAVQVALAVTGLLAARTYSRLVLWRFAPYGLFVAWMFARSAIEPPAQAGMQNGIAYLLFAVHVLFAGTLAARRPVATLFVVRRGMLVLDAVALALVATSLLRFGLPCESCRNGAWLVGPRSVALLAIVPTSWHLAGWCHGRRYAGLLALAWIVAVLASLSRTATAVAFVTAAIAFLIHAWTLPTRLVRQVPGVAIGAAVLALLVTSYQATFRERFLEGYNNVDVAGVSISTSGRDSIWPAIIESGARHPIFGGGLGSSQAALGDFDPSVVGHPHNDYLRVWHDGGVFAVSFLMLAFLRWLAILRRQWIRTVQTSQPHPEVELAALFILMGLMLAAITDNGFVYTFVMGPAGLLIGVALSVRVRAVRQGRAVGANEDANARAAS
jgi:O-antigen ligase